MIVRCIKEDYTKSSSEVVQAILKVGDDHLLPKKGQEYEVIGFAHFKGGKEAYLLDGLDTTNYGSQVCFCKEDFEYVKDSYKPNGICETTGMLCMKVDYYIEDIHDFSNTLKTK